jgi:hypothetical protein
MPTIACLAAQYAWLPLRAGRKPAPEAMLTMRPYRAFFITGAHACDNQNAPLTLASKIACQSLSLIASIGPRPRPRDPPAPLTRISSRPWAATIAATVCPHASRSPMSRWCGIAPLSATASRPSKLMSATWTLAPALTSRVAMARPIPCAAPVTSATRSLKS